MSPHEQPSSSLILNIVASRLLLVSMERALPRDCDALLRPW
jgi:hypothetical protein